MAVVTSLTAARMLQIEQSSVTGGLVDPQGRLILSTRGGDSIDAGSVQGVGPAGTISMYAGHTAPQGHLLCDGSEVLREDYPVLFSVIGTTYGAGDGSTTFNLPNLKGRVVVGVDESQTEFSELGLEGGAKTHKLTVAEMPKHTHTQNPHNHTQNSHTHGQNSHTHSQSSHTHSQYSHSHTQASHSHTQASHSHTMDTPRWLSADNNTGGTMFAEPTNVEKRVLNRPINSTSGPTIYSATPAIDSETASNYSATASNNSATASNQSATATNNAATATNQTTGGDAPHNNLQPYVTLNYIIKT